jgi:hypothetical protein
MRCGAVRCGAVIKYRAVFMFFIKFLPQKYLHFLFKTIEITPQQINLF